MNWGRAFLALPVLAYGAAFFLNRALFFSALEAFASLCLRIAPAMAVVIILMWTFNEFSTKALIERWLSQTGWKPWAAATIGGILSMGPVYLWYPLIADLREKGLPASLAACFLYNRAVKLPLLPLLASYFGWVYALVLGIWTIIFSILNGLIVGGIAK